MAGRSFLHYSVSLVDRYLVAYEEFHRKMGDTHMFEGSRSQSRRQVAGGRNVMPPRDREALHLHSGIASPNEQKVCGGNHEKHKNIQWV